MSAATAALPGGGPSSATHTSLSVSTDLASTAEDMRDEGGRVRADTGAVVEGYRAVPLHGAQVDAI